MDHVMQLKLPPTIMVFSWRGGREDQKECWCSERAGAYMLRMVILESLGWEMETSIT